MEGLEPPHLAASDPKSDVSTNFTTWAFKGCKSNGFDGNEEALMKSKACHQLINYYQKL
jgi:hypothetical protein